MGLLEQKKYWSNEYEVLVALMFKGLCVWGQVLSLVASTSHRQGTVSVLTAAAALGRGRSKWSRHLKKDISSVAPNHSIDPLSMTLIA